MRLFRQFVGLTRLKGKRVAVNCTQKRRVISNGYEHRSDGEKDRIEKENTLMDLVKSFAFHVLRPRDT